MKTRSGRQVSVLEIIFVNSSRVPVFRTVRIAFENNSITN